MDLADFLLARIAEDEALAREADARVYPTTWQEAKDRVPLGYQLAHIVKWDPARVLAECEAKRRIIDACGRWTESTARSDLADEVLELLARPYANHPDYAGANATV